MYEYKARVIKVVDGDTFDAIVELGFNMTATLRFRLQNIDTPELNSKFTSEVAEALKAKARVIELVLDKDIILKSFKNGAPTLIREVIYNRWEASVILMDGRVLKDILISENLIKKPSYT